jgi:hypothetical protein
MYLILRALLDVHDGDDRCGCLRRCILELASPDDTLFTAVAAAAETLARHQLGHEQRCP